MPSLKPGKFSNPELLRELRPDLLKHWLWPMRDYFTRRGLHLPPPEAVASVHYDHLSRVLTNPGADMPEALLESLYLFRELDNAPAMDALQEEARRRGLDLGLDANVIQTSSPGCLTAAAQSGIEPLYTVQKVAEPLSVDDAFVLELIKTRKVTGMQLDENTLRISAGSVQRYLAKIALDSTSKFR